MTAEVAELAEVVRREIRKAQTPWCDRKAAAEYCNCGTTTIDTARRCGFIKDYGSPDMPRFKKKNLDAWIEAEMPTHPNTETAKEIERNSK